MTHTITAQDGSGDSTTPAVIERYATDNESGNTVHRLIDGIAVTLVGDLPRTGTLNLSYESDTDAETARALLGRAASFTLTSSTRPAVDMTFVRAGAMSVVAHEKITGLWGFQVGFQEILP